LLWSRGSFLRTRWRRVSCWSARFCGALRANGNAWSATLESRHISRARANLEPRVTNCHQLSTHQETWHAVDRERNSPNATAAILSATPGRVSREGGPVVSLWRATVWRSGSVQLPVPGPVRQAASGPPPAAAGRIQPTDPAVSLSRLPDRTPILDSGRSAAAP